MGTPYPKQQMHRIACTKLTPQQIAAKLAPAATGGPTYLYWLEEACNGTLGAILVNLRTMHDAGIEKADYANTKKGWTIAGLTFEPV